LGTRYRLRCFEVTVGGLRVITGDQFESGRFAVTLWDCRELLCIAVGGMNRTRCNICRRAGELAVLDKRGIRVVGRYAFPGGLNKGSRWVWARRLERRLAALRGDDAVFVAVKVYLVRVIEIREHSQVEVGVRLVQRITGVGGNEKLCVHGRLSVPGGTSRKERGREREGPERGMLTA
jgi:hypothetical protein